MFKLPSDPSTDYIKRVIGLPGDKIQMRHGKLYINDQQVQRVQVADQHAATGRRRDAASNIPRPCRAAGGAVSTASSRSATTACSTTRAVYDVPPGHYFMMGDNRDNSEDSRVMSAVGYVPAENLVGRPQFMFFSTDGRRAWWEIWKWPFAIRYDRLFHGIK